MLINCLLTLASFLWNTDDTDLTDFKRIYNILINPLLTLATFLMGHS